MGDGDNEDWVDIALLCSSYVRYMNEALWSRLRFCTH